MPSVGRRSNQVKALARAAYARPQIALFDDVFSGLDSRTANTVFERLFGKHNGLFRSWNATVVLATQSGTLRNDEVARFRS